MNGIVLVIGGTGKTGSRLVTRLVQEGWRVRCASRSGKAPAGAEGIVFDWFDDSSHAAALAGVDRVYLVAPVGSNDPLAAMLPFLERAIERRVRRFVLLSSSLLEEGGPAMGQVHAFLHQNAPEWTVLRPSWFMENFSENQHSVTICAEDAIYSATGDGLVPFVAAADIAEVALRALINEVSFDSDMVLTGPEAMTYDTAAATIGAACGRPIRHICLSGEEMTARFESIGVPGDYAAMLAGLDLAIAAGAEARTTTVVEDVTGRSGMTLAAFAAENAGAWAKPA